MRSREADRDPRVRALVLAGEGKGFCAGADLKEFEELTPANQAAVVARADLTTRLHLQIPALSKPVVAAVQGVAVGGGAGLAIACDMVVAGDDLKFGYPELRHSLVPAIVMTSLQRAVERKAAFELISLGRLIGAEEALRLGFVNRIVPPSAVLDEALAIADTWAKVKPVAMARRRSSSTASPTSPTSPPWRRDATSTRSCEAFATETTHEAARRRDHRGFLARPRGPDGDADPRRARRARDQGRASGEAATNRANGSRASGRRAPISSRSTAARN